MNAVFQWIYLAKTIFKGLIVITYIMTHDTLNPCFQNKFLRQQNFLIQTIDFTPV